MTHSLHREGTPDSLERDFVLFVYPAKGFNYTGSAPKVRRLTELLVESKPVNLSAKTRQRKIEVEGKPGEPKQTVTVEGESFTCIFDCHQQAGPEVVQYDGTRVYAVFDSRNRLKEALTRIKKANQGISIMVSGRIDRVREIAADTGIDPYMINLSLGVHGRTDRLPPPDLREFTTMCGHGLVSPHLVRDTIRRVKTGKVSEAEACALLAEPCICGIHNPRRSAELLQERAPLYAVDRW
jgi:hypothetical protein